MKTPELAAEWDGAAGSPGEAPVRALLKERAYSELKRLILSGKIAPGSFLTERQLAARLGVSKTPIRSALERLEAEGFVSISPQQGAIVRSLSLREIGDLYEIRLALDAFVARSLAGRLTPDQVGSVRANLDEQRANIEVGDVGRGVVLDGAFHGLFCEFLGNGEILRTTAQLRDKVQRVIFHAFTSSPDRMSASYNEHRGISDAIIEGDADLAVRRLEDHLEIGKVVVFSRQRAESPAARAGRPESPHQ